MALQFKLSHSEKYVIIDCNYLSIMDGGGWSCENCGKLITNVVTVENSQGKQFLIGTDCAKTLSSLHDSDIKRAESQIGQFKKFYKELSEGVKQDNDTRKTFIYSQDGKVTIWKAILSSYHDGRPYIFLKTDYRKIPLAKLAESYKKHLWTKQDILNFNNSFANEWHFNNVL